MNSVIPKCPHADFEVFCDPSYYDMWCLRRIGSRDFNDTVHFMNENQALHASYVIASWISDNA